jgi:hypothetical protein
MVGESSARSAAAGQSDPPSWGSPSDAQHPFRKWLTRSELGLPPADATYERQEATAFFDGRSRSVGGRRSVLVFENRLLESLVYLVVGIICLVLGLLSANVNYQVLFFILTAFFFFAIFRPTSLS